MKRAAPLLVLGTLLLVIAVSFSTLTSFLVDWLWFDSLGFGAVFSTIWQHQAARSSRLPRALSVAGAGVNGLIATRAAGRRGCGGCG